jgi:hypothetical protein
LVLLDPPSADLAPIAPQRQALLTQCLLTKSAPLDSISPPISRFDTKSA